MTNKTEKTAKIYVSYKKYKGGSFAYSITLSCTRPFESELSWLSLEKSFVTAHHIALTEKPVIAYPVSRQVDWA